MRERSQKKGNREWARKLVLLGVLGITLMVQPIQAMAGSVTTGNMGAENGIRWSYDADREILTLSGKDSGLSGSKDKGSQFCEKFGQVRKIVLDDFTPVGNAQYLFANLSKLEDIEMKKVDTSMVTNMSQMFENCSRLKTVDFSSWNTSEVTIMAGMFRGCSSLKTLDISSFDTKKVTSFYWFFRDCSSLESVKWEEINTSQVKSIEKMFAGCSNLKEMDISHWDTSKVTSMAGLFENCTGLEKVNLSGLKTDALTNMGNMFSGCGNLTQIDISSFNTSNVSSFYGLFYNCSKLTDINLTGINTSKANNLERMFMGCSSLKQISLRGLDFSQVTNMVCLFKSCSSLMAVDLAGLNTAKVTKMSSMFEDCSNLLTVNLKDVNTSAVTTMYAMFKGCSKLEELNVSGFHTEQVTSMWSMFRDCAALKSLDVSGFNTGKVTSVSNMFQNCSSLKVLDLSSFDLSNATQWGSMLQGCEALVHIDTPKATAGELLEELPHVYLDLDGKEVTEITKKTCNKCLIIKGRQVNSIVISREKQGNLQVGDSEQLSALIRPENAVMQTVKWSSAKTDVVTVDVNGKVKAVGPGTATIIGEAQDSSKVSGEITVTVVQPVKAIILDQANLTLKVGESSALSITVVPSDASNKDVTWKSSDTSVVVIDTSGKVKAVGPGSADITVTARDGSGKSASCAVDVTQPVTGITLNLTDLNLEVGGSKTLTAKVSPDNASNRTVSWKSSDTAVATVDNCGKVTAVALGTATITVTAQDGSGKSAGCTITVKEINPFGDVKESSWQYSFVKFVYDNNIMAGKGKTTDGKIVFDPDKYMTRAEFVQTLYNKEGKPAVTYTNTFTDVPKGEWYTNAILWAFRNGIVTGKGGRFDISGKITREEVATILYKYATNYKSYDTTGRASLDAYEDTGCISSWAENNMKWAIHYGIMKGRGKVLAPQDNASRAECATMLKNFMDAYNLVET